jgi:hypothetical protein
MFRLVSVYYVTRRVTGADISIPLNRDNISAILFQIRFGTMVKTILNRAKLSHNISRTCFRARVFENAKARCLLPILDLGQLCTSAPRLFISIRAHLCGFVVKNLSGVMRRYATEPFVCKPSQVAVKRWDPPLGVQALACPLPLPSAVTM